MSIPARGVTLPRAELIRSEMEAVLSSELFERAPSLGQFLRYVCEKALRGELSEIKEYSIAVEALGRPADFDQKVDAIVRVEAHRLRKRLKRYYETEGAGHAIEIAIPPGQYVPVFEPRSDPVLSIPRPSVRVVEIVPVRRRVGRWPWIVAGVVVVACLAAMLFRPRQAAVPAGVRMPEPTPAGPPAPSGEGIRIACGLTAPQYVDSLGRMWLGDRFFLGGRALASSWERIWRSRDPDLFRHRREGDFGYRIPLDPGTYELHLYFAERVYGSDNLAGGGETTRIFHVFANGVPIAENMDVIADAAGSNTANERVYTDIRPGPDGFLRLHFSPFSDTAFVNGIEILPGVPGKMRPIRILAGSASYRDRNGDLWTADRYSQGGQAIARMDPVASSGDPGLYRWERFGNFSYVIPAAAGRYTVNLYFAEAWFGPGLPRGGGAGSRVFDVHCNGIALLKDFDIYKAAGGANRGIVRSYRGLTPNAQGKLVLSFVPGVNYACVNAIEVLAEGE